MAERLDVSRDGSTLAGERWPGGGQTVLLLHEGVADRRGWAQVAGLLAPELTVVAYDRRGYGQTPPSTEPFSHLDDLLAVIGHAGAGPVWLAGASAGGRLALDAAVAAPGRLAGLGVMGTAGRVVSGITEAGRTVIREVESVITPDDDTPPPAQLPRPARPPEGDSRGGEAAG